jgi:hypothetical protein
VNDAQMERSLLCSQRKCSTAIGNQGPTMLTFVNYAQDHGKLLLLWTRFGLAFGISIPTSSRISRVTAWPRPATNERETELSVIRYSRATTIGLSSGLKSCRLAARSDVGADEQSKREAPAPGVGSLRTACARRCSWVISWVGRRRRRKAESGQASLAEGASATRDYGYQD